MEPAISLVVAKKLFKDKQNSMQVVRGIDIKCVMYDELGDYVYAWHTKVCKYNEIERSLNETSTMIYRVSTALRDDGLTPVSIGTFLVKLTEELAPHLHELGINKFMGATIENKNR